MGNFSRFSLLRVRFDSITPIVYTFGMHNYSVINLKTDPKLKKRAMETANKLGISLSAVLNNELRRFTIEQSVVFEQPEVPTTKTAQVLAKSVQEIEQGDYYRFEQTEDALQFLADDLKWSLVTVKTLSNNLAALIQLSE